MKVTLVVKTLSGKTFKREFERQGHATTEIVSSMHRGFFQAKDYSWIVPTVGIEYVEVKK